MTDKNWNYSAEMISCSKYHIDVLYDLLKSREFFISHSKVPSYTEHKNFVINNPYKAWFIIKDGEEPIGSVYLKYDNSIGINVQNQDIDLISWCLNFIKDNYRPEKSVKTIIPDYFYINVPFENKKLKSNLNKLQFKAIQTSFRIG